MRDAGGPAVKIPPAANGLARLRVAYRRRSALMIILILGVTLAGCFGDGTGDDDHQDPSAPPKGSDEVTKRATAQPRSSTLDGYVADDDGQPISGAEVLLERGLSATEQVVTNETGQFAFDHLESGRYTLTVTATFYEDHWRNVELLPGQNVSLVVNLTPEMLAPNVPARYGKVVDYVSDTDIILGGAGVGEFPRAAVTRKTATNPFPGFWPVTPEQGYLIARIEVQVAPNWLTTWTPAGVHYFRGENATSNELVEGGDPRYHDAEFIENSTFFLISTYRYTIDNEDWTAWGARDWQVGVRPHSVEAYTGTQSHSILIRAVLVETSYAEALASG